MDKEEQCPRPSGMDTEDDLLRMQEQFLSSKSRPAAQVIRVGEKRKSGADDEKQNQPHFGKKQAEERDIVTLGELPGSFKHTNVSTDVKPSVSTKKKKVQTKRTDDEDDPEKRLEDHDQHITKVLADIMERDLDNIPVYYPSGPVEGGFPKVLHRGNITPQAPLSEGKGKKKSLFAQQFDASSPQRFGLPTRRVTVPVTRNPVTRPDKPLADIVKERDPGVFASLGSSQVIKGSGLDGEKGPQLVQDIHEENAAKLSALGEEEILSEQKKLLEMLDPSIISFFKKKTKVSTTEKEQQIASETSKATSSSEQVEPQTEAMEISELPVKPEKDWVNMNKVEAEKLSWMKDLPVPAPGDSQTGKPARFDFHGDLVAMDADLPTHLGLHHHGDEPDRAGYTLEELFYLARSAHMQQRTLAINLIAKIINNAKHGKFHQCMSTPLLPAVVEGGLVFLLRWALDDSTENTLAATVSAFHSLLVLPEDNEALDKVFCWYRGHEVPCLCPFIQQSESQTEEEEDQKDNKKSDSDLLKQDMIKGLLQMSLLQRLRYILEVWRPQVATVNQVLDILIRIAQHSPEVSYQVTQCPRMMETIFKEYLPWKLPEKDNPAMLTACGKALKLIRVICTAGRNMAASIVSHYPLLEQLVLYINQNMEESNLDIVEIRDLLKEVMHLWKICLVYGLGVMHFREHFSLLMEKLQEMNRLNHKSESQLLVHGASLISLLESAVHTAASSTLLAAQQSAASPRGEAIEHTTTEAVPELNWSHVTGLVQPVFSYLQKATQEFITFYFEQPYDLSFISGCFNFIASYFIRNQSLPSYNAVEVLEQMEVLCEEVILELLQSPSLSAALKNLRHNSVLLYAEPPKKPESVSSLPGVGSLLGSQADRSPVLHERCSVQFVLAVCRLLLSMKAHKGLIAKLYPPLLEHEEMLQYIRRVCQARRSPTASNHFCVFENQLQFILLELVRHQGGSTASVGVYHQMSLYLLTHLTEGSEFTVQKLLSTIVFNSSFMGDMLSHHTDPTLGPLSHKLQIQEEVPLCSATQEKINLTQFDFVKDISSGLASLRDTYMKAFGGFQKALQASREREEESSCIRQSLMLGTCGQLLVPIDWPFLPLIEIYSVCTAVNKSSEKSSPATVAMVINALRWTYFLEEYRPGALDSVSVSLRLSRLFCTLLAGNDLFLDSNVRIYLNALLKIYCKPIHLNRMEFTKPIPGLASFYDLYTMVLDQYEAVSYADELFGNYILLPMQQRHRLVFRKAVWSEHLMTVRAMGNPLQQIVIPVQNLLEPEETDLELIRLYYQSLLSHSVIKSRSPLPYLIAVHHVNRFFYTQETRHIKIRHAMVKQILATKDQILRHDMLHYKTYNPAECVMDFYTELPPIRQSLIDKIKSLS